MCFEKRQSEAQFEVSFVLLKFVLFSTDTRAVIFVMSAFETGNAYVLAWRYCRYVVTTLLAYYL